MPALPLRSSCRPTCVFAPRAIAVDQVLDNLLANSFAASPEGSTIDVTARRVGDQVELRVSDEGPGLSQEDKARAFDRFWRGHESGAGADWDWPSCVASSSAMADRSS